MSVTGHRTKPGDAHKRAGPTRVAPRGDRGEQGRGQASVLPVHIQSQGAVGTRPHSRGHTSRLALLCPSPLSHPWGQGWDVLGPQSGSQGGSSQSQHMPRARGWWCVPPTPGYWVPTLGSGLSEGPQRSSPQPLQQVQGTQHHPWAGSQDAWAPGCTRTRGTPTTTPRWDTGKGARLQAALGGSTAPQKAQLPIHGGNTLPSGRLAASHRTKAPPSARSHMATAVPRSGHGGPRSPVPGGATHPL